MITSRLNLFKTLILLFTLNFQCALGKEVLKFNSFEIPKFILSKETGTFVDYLHLVFKDSPWDVEVDVLPPRRSYKLFMDGKADGFIPTNKARVKEGFYNSDIYFYKDEYLFALNEIKDIPTKGRVCITDGYLYDTSAFSKEIQIVKTSSDNSCLKMLLKGRVDYFLGEILSCTRKARDMGLKNIKAYPRAISTTEVTIGIRKGNGMEKVLKFVNKRIRELNKSGEAKNIFKKDIDLVKNILGLSIDPTSP